MKTQHKPGETSGFKMHQYHFPWFTITLSGIQAAAFLYEASRLWNECGIPVGLYGPGIPDLCSDIVYSPTKRCQWWRHITHCFAHDGWLHILGNLVLNFLFGMPIERAYGPLQTGALFFAGVLNASLGCSVLRPDIAGAGGSAGLCAFMAALLTMKEHKITKTKQLAAFSIIEDLARFICFGFNSVNDTDADLLKQIKSSDFVAHEIGTITGFLYGLYVLGNMEVRSWKGTLLRISIVLWHILIIAAVLINIFKEEWFPPESGPICKSICDGFYGSTLPGKSSDMWINIHRKIQMELLKTRRQFQDYLE